MQVKKNVIKVDNQVIVINKVWEYVIHKGLEGSRGITKAKSHNEGFKKAKGAFEGCIPFITFLDSYVVITPLYIKLCEVVEFLEFINKFRN